MKPCKRLEIVIEQPLAQRLAQRLIELEAPGLHRHRPRRGHGRPWYTPRRRTHGHLNQLCVHHRLRRTAHHRSDRRGKRAARNAAQTCIGRNGEDADLDGPLLFLCSEASRYVTGQVMMLDGGFTAK